MNKKKKRKREGVVLIRVTSPASQTASVLSFQHVKRTKMGILPVYLAPQQSMTTLAFTGLVVIVRWNIHIVVSVSNVLLPYFIRKTDYMRARIIKHPEIYLTHHELHHLVLIFQNRDQFIVLEIINFTFQKCKCQVVNQCCVPVESNKCDCQATTDDVTREDAGIWLLKGLVFKQNSNAPRGIIKLQRFMHAEGP